MLCATRTRVSVTCVYVCMAVRGRAVPMRFVCALIIGMHAHRLESAIGGSASEVAGRRDPTRRVAASIWRSDRDTESCVDMTASSQQLQAPRELKRFSEDSSAESPAERTLMTEQSVSSKQLHAPREFGSRGTGEIPPVDANASSKQLHAPRELKRGCSDHSVQGDPDGSRYELLLIPACAQFTEQHGMCSAY